MDTISTEALRKKIEHGDDFALVEVLPPEQYEEYHLPGAINIPLGDDFENKAERALSDKNQEIVVYCSDQNCSASPAAADKLRRLGYRRVLAYQLGKRDWRRTSSHADSSQMRA